MDERLQFMARRLADGGTLQRVRISRRTGYKIFDRYQECGVQGLTDRSRRPYRFYRQLPFQIENRVLDLRTIESLFQRGRTDQNLPARG